MSEDSDAVIVVVSEETGVISVALNGTLTRDLSRNQLYDKLTELLVTRDAEHSNLFLSMFKSRKEKTDE
jgi:diadenylate cyclase